MNRPILAALSSILFAQGLKIPFEFFKTGKWNFGTALTPGGMPSSHSAGVTSLATYVGLKKGFKSTDFAISALLGVIVMYDAAGVRYQAGQTAVVVNDLEEDMEKLYKTIPELRFHRKKEIELKERLGHLPSEVMVGALFGMAMGGMAYLFGKRK